MEENNTEATEGFESQGSEDTGVTDVAQDNSFDNDYKDDFSIDTQATAEEIANPEDNQDYSDEDVNEAMMDYLRENYDMPDKFQDVESLISSYKHLEGKMGQMKGAPDTYELEADVFDGYDEGILEGVVGTAREMGLSNDGLNQLLSSAMKSQSKTQEANWEMEKHKMGVNADREISDALQTLNAQYSPEISETIQGMIQTADQFYALRDLMNGSRPSAPAQTQRTAQPTTDADISKMLFAKDDFGNLKMESDSQYAAKVNGMMNNNW